MRGNTRFLLVALILGLALGVLLLVKLGYSSSHHPTLSVKEIHLRRCFFGLDSSCVFDYEWDETRLSGSSPLLKPRIRTHSGWALIRENEEELDMYEFTRKLNVLYFNERREYMEKMDRYFYDEVNAAASHPKLNVRLWGPGWKGYNKKLTPTENNISAFPDIQFDIIYTKTWHRNVTSNTAVVVHGTGDCHNHKCIRSAYYPTHADAITWRYAGLIMEFGRPEQWKQREAKRIAKKYPFLNESEQAGLQQPMPFFFHSPDCADENLLHPIHEGSSLWQWLSEKRWEDTRPHLIRLIGNTKDSLYPIRAKVRDGILRKQIINAEVYEHVGYVLDQSLGQSSDKKNEGMNSREIGIYDRFDPDVSHHRRNQQEWSKVLATTQICVFDSSIVRKAIRKFQESFMSGCVVAADIPLEMESMFQNVVIPLRPDMTAEDINNVLQGYLRDKERLAWMAMEAFKRARMHWSCRNKVDRLIQAAEMVVEGERGYWFPFGYKATCRRFGEESQYTTEWCRKV
ncbi:hypothetical protein BDR26DRAFT_890178 [Obelidium mucronatum]|nr:hypothetical protein BDR26DRAFT_890178 [Obelidium mucronatum]